MTQICGNLIGKLRIISKAKALARPRATKNEDIGQWCHLSNLILNKPLLQTSKKYVCHTWETKLTACN